MAPGPRPTTKDEGRTSRGAALGAHSAAMGLARPWLPVARAVWVVLALLLAALFGLGNVAYYRQSVALLPIGNFMLETDPGAYRVALAQLGLSATVYATIMVGLLFALMLGSAVAGWAIFLSKGRSWWPLYVSLTLVGLGASFPTTTDALTRAYPSWSLLLNLVNNLSLASFLELFYLFPDGHFVPRWTRWPALAMAAVFVLGALFPGTVADLGTQGWFFPVANSFLVITMVYAQVYRYRHVSRQVERQQTKWAVSGMTLVLLSLMGMGAIPSLFPGLVNPASRGALYDMVATAALLVVALAIPLSLGISIMRYRLWDIDLIINRTLVYVPLTAIVAGLYSAMIAVAQKLFIAFTGARSDAAVVLSTLLLVTTFTPIKNGIQALVDSWFKPKPDPRQKLDARNQQMRWFVQLMDEPEITQGALTDAVLAFHAAGAAVYLSRGGGLALACREGRWDEATRPAMSVPLRVAGNDYGVFQLSGRRDGSPYSPEDERKLLETVGLLGQTLATARRTRVEPAHAAEE